MAVGQNNVIRCSGTHMPYFRRFIERQDTYILVLSCYLYTDALDYKRNSWEALERGPVGPGLGGSNGLPEASKKLEIKTF